MISKIKSDNDRIETGVLQNNNDWPGLFVRGDDCVLLGFVLTSYLETMKEANDRFASPSAESSSLILVCDLLEEIENLRVE